MVPEQCANAMARQVACASSMHVQELIKHHEGVPKFQIASDWRERVRCSQSRPEDGAATVGNLTSRDLSKSAKTCFTPHATLLGSGYTWKPSSSCLTNSPGPPLLVATTTLPLAHPSRTTMPGFGLGGGLCSGVGGCGGWWLGPGDSRCVPNGSFFGSLELVVGGWGLEV